MFDHSLPEPQEFAGVSDAVLAQAVAGWAAASAAAEARKLAAAAEVARRAATGKLRERQAIDDVDAAAAVLFPGWNTTTPSAPAPDIGSPPVCPGRHLMMPTRRRTRAQNRAARIAAERRLNSAERDCAAGPTAEPATADVGPLPDVDPPRNYGDDPPPF